MRQVENAKLLSPRQIRDRVGVVAAIFGYFGTFFVLFLLTDGFSKPSAWLHGFPSDFLAILWPLIFVPASVLTWLILYRFLYTRSIIPTIFVGAISPFVGCVAGILYAGMGVFWFGYVVALYYFFAPFGIATALTIRFFIFKPSTPSSGFEVQLKRQPDEDR